jgi:hypothetical protein
VSHDAGTAYVWFGSASQATLPSLATLMNLYAMTAEGGKAMVTDHNGLLLVYWAALSATALAGAQLPSAESLPTLDPVRTD